MNELKINWYPGHMAKTMKEIREKKDLVDCFVVVLDSRIPLSTYNEEFDKISPSKPRLFILSKSELSIKKEIEKIKPKFNNEKDMVLDLNLRDIRSRQKIISALKIILKNKIEKDKSKRLLISRLKCFVVGLPNVGKSTLINLMAKNKKLKVANFPGTTKTLKWLIVDNIYLLDSPGVMFPKIQSDEIAIKLVACNLIKKEVINDYEFIIRYQDIIINKKPSWFSEIGINYFKDEKDKYSELIKYGKKNNIYTKSKIIDEKRLFSLIREKMMNINNLFLD